jgi:hypothetical protein
VAGCWLELSRAGSTLTMPESRDELSKIAPSSKRHSMKGSRKSPRRRFVFTMASLVGASLVTLAGAAWLGSKASEIESELTSATHLISALKEEIAKNDAEGAAATVNEVRNHTAAAKKAVDDPLWTLASALPGLGPNFSAVAEVARSADDVAAIGLAPLVDVYATLDWNKVLPSRAGTDLGALQAASPSVTSAATAVRLSAARLNAVDESKLLPQVAEPLSRARAQLNEVTGTLDSAASAAEILPGMLGAEIPRSYLLMIQNNAELRASGGIPGALAVLNLEKGKLTLTGQGSAGALGTMTPVLPVDAEQQQIYTGRLGKYMQDVNLTPDFPSAAGVAQAMWERGTGQRVDGVLSIDPIALAYVLDATGPVEMLDPNIAAMATASGLPRVLTGSNVVQTLLSDVYAKIEQPQLQDAYFAGVAKEIFAALSNSKNDSKGLISGITRATEERRISVWSSNSEEQSVIAAYPLGGSVAGPSVLPSQFGVYFNDGTGAKMDYYVKRTVQLVKHCPRDGYEETTVRISATNTAPQDAATVLPEYVTGGGTFGVPPGSVQTNIVAYGPVQANIETATLDGRRTDFAPYLHSNRPVGVLAIRLAPGESKTVAYTFGKIVQHTEPNVVVTPTVQDVKDVTLPTENTVCD